MNTPRDDRFDAAMRQRHADAATRLSARTQAQLRQRRSAALSGQASALPILRRAAWPLAASLAALAVIAVGMQLQKPPPPVPPRAHLAATPAQDARPGDAGSVLDETPDFYLWLASSDARTLAME